jgi:hypothetical protein
VGHQVLLQTGTAASEGAIVEPKTEASNAFVWVPQTLAMELDFWMEGMRVQRPEFLFASRSERGTPMSANNFLNEH